MAEGKVFESALTNVSNPQYVRGIDSSGRSIKVPASSFAKPSEVQELVSASEAERQRIFEQNEAQRQELHNKVAELEQKVGKFEIPTTEEKKYINLNGGIGSIAPIDRPDGNASWRYMLFPVESGDTVTINGVGGVSPRLYAFLDSTNKIIEVSGTDTSASNLEKIAPTNSAFIVINDKSNSISYITKKRSLEADKVNREELAATNLLVDALSKDVDKMNNTVDGVFHYVHTDKGTTAFQNYEFKANESYIIDNQGSDLNQFRLYTSSNGAIANCFEVNGEIVSVLPLTRKTRIEFKVLVDAPKFGAWHGGSVGDIVFDLINKSSLIPTLKEVSAGLKKIEDEIITFTDNEETNKYIRELYLIGDKEKIENAKVCYISADGEIYITDESGIYPTNAICHGYSALSDDGLIVELNEYNASGVHGYALLVKPSTKRYEKAQVQNADLLQNSPTIYSYIKNKSGANLKDLSMYYGTKFYSLGDSITYQQRWQSKLAKLKQMNYVSSATTNTAHPLGVGGSTICPFVNVTETDTGVPCIGRDGNQIKDKNGNNLYFEIGQGVNQSIYYRADYLKDVYTDADVITIFGGTNDAVGKNYAELGTKEDVPYEGMQYVLPQYAVIAEHYDNVAILNDGSYLLESKYLNGSYTLITSKPSFASCLVGTIKKIQTSNPAARLICCTILRRPQLIDTYYEPRYNRHLLMSEIYKYYGCCVANLWDDMGVSPYTANSLFTDGIHPNEIGGNVIATIIANKL